MKTSPQQHMFSAQQYLKEKKNNLLFSSLSNQRHTRKKNLKTTIDQHVQSLIFFALQFAETFLQGLLLPIAPFTLKLV